MPGALPSPQEALLGHGAQVERCWPMSLHALVSDTPNWRTSTSTVRRLRPGVRLFPRRSHSAWCCPRSDRPRWSSAACSRLELLQPLGIGRLHSAVGVLPAVPGGLGDRKGASHLSDGCPLVEHLVAFSQLSDHLLGGVVKRTSSSETSISILEASTYISAGTVFVGPVISTIRIPTTTTRE